MSDQPDHRVIQAHYEDGSTKMFIGAERAVTVSLRWGKRPRALTYYEDHASIPWIQLQQVIEGDDLDHLILAALHNLSKT